jgi:hypothetical protein
VLPNNIRAQPSLRVQDFGLLGVENESIALEKEGECFGSDLSIYSRQGRERGGGGVVLRLDVVESEGYEVRWVGEGVVEDLGAQLEGEGQ